jgi:hypothetical protein
MDENCFYAYIATMLSGLAADLLFSVCNRLLWFNFAAIVCGEWSHEEAIPSSLLLAIHPNCVGEWGISRNQLREEARSDRKAVSLTIAIPLLKKGKGSKSLLR